MQVPHTRVVRDGHIVQVPARDVVLGDIVEVEAGDIAPADGRIIRSATLETQEAALTGESAPRRQGRGRAAGRDVALGDRTNMLFQNTSVTRGTGAMRRDGHRHGHRDGPDRDDADLGVARPVAAAEGARLADEGLGVIAWSAVAFIVVVGLIRGLDFDDLVLLGTAMAISAIPTGMPAFVSACSRSAPSSSPRPGRSSRTSTDVETLVRRARSTPTRPAR